MKLKRDPAIFQSLILKGERVDIPENNLSLIFGDNTSAVSIIAFMSYYCSACAKKYSAIKKLIDDKIRARIQLVFPASKDELSMKFNMLICSIKKSGNENEIPNLLADWYNADKKTRQGLLDKYIAQSSDDHVNDIMEYNSMLFQSGKIAKVPSIYVNGFPLPDSYELEDIKYFLDFLGNMRFETNKVEV